MTEIQGLEKNPKRPFEDFFCQFLLQIQLYFVVSMVRSARFLRVSLSFPALGISTLLGLNQHILHTR